MSGIDTKLVVSAATASSSSGSFTPDLSLDGNNSTWWASQQSGALHWIRYDFGAVNFVGYVRVFWLREPQFNAYQFNIQTSSDGTTFTTVFSGSSGAPVTDFQSYNVSTNTRYIRIILTANATGDEQLVVREFQAWSGQISAPLPPPPAPPTGGSLQDRKYTFTIDTSNDNQNWVQQFSGDSESKGEAQLEVYDFTDVDARFVRINVLGNDKSTFASIIETAIFGNVMPIGEQMPPIPTPNPSPQFQYNWFRHGYHVNYSTGDICSGGD